MLSLTNLMLPCLVIMKSVWVDISVTESVSFELYNSNSKENFSKISLQENSARYNCYNKWPFKASLQSNI